MLGGNGAVTIWNRHGGRFFRHVVGAKCRFTQRGVSQAHGAGDSMFASVSSIIVCRIPYTETYAAPDVWREIPDGLKSGYFTVQADDFVALGEHRLEIGKDREAGEITAPELRQRLEGCVMQAKAVRYSLHTRLGRHVRVEGV